MNVVFYENENTNKPAKEFLEKQDTNVKVVVAKIISKYY